MQENKLQSTSIYIVFIFSQKNPHPSRSKHYQKVTLTGTFYFQISHASNNPPQISTLLSLFYHSPNGFSFYNTSLTIYFTNFIFHTSIPPPILPSAWSINSEKSSLHHKFSGLFSRHQNAYYFGLALHKITMRSFLIIIIWNYIPVPL